MKVADLATGKVLVEMSARQLEQIERLDKLVSAVDAAVSEWLGAAVPDPLGRITEPPPAKVPEKLKVLPVKKKARAGVKAGEVTLIDRVRAVMADGVTRSVKDVVAVLDEPDSTRLAKVLATHKKDFERVNYGVYRAKKTLAVPAPVAVEKNAAPVPEDAAESEENYRLLRITPVGLLSEEQLESRMRLAKALGRQDMDARSEFLKRRAQS